MEIKLTGVTGCTTIVSSDISVSSSPFFYNIFSLYLLLHLYPTFINFLLDELNKPLLIFHNTTS